MPRPDNAPDFLPGDPNPERANRPPDSNRPPETLSTPARRELPVPMVILGVAVVLTLLVIGFFAIRVGLSGDPQGTPTPAPTPSVQGPVPDEPGITLDPRTGTPAPIQRAEVGDTIDIEGLYGNGTVRIIGAEWSSVGDLPASPGRQYLNVELEYTGTEGSVFTSLNHFAAYDDQKNEYLPGIGSGKIQLEDQEIKTGGSARGWVSIEVPPGTTFFVISDEGINPLVLVTIPGP